MNESTKTKLANFRLSRAEKNLDQVEILIDNELWDTAINRIYYSCFYAVTALLINNNINAKTHNGVRQMFGLHFVKEGVVPEKLGKFYSDIFEMRHTVDYDDFIVVTEEEVVDSFDTAKEFLVIIKTVLHDN